MLWLPVLIGICKLVDQGRLAHHCQETDLTAQEEDIPDDPKLAIVKKYPDFYNGVATNET